MIILSNVRSAESRGVIYNINSVAPCCDQKVQPTACFGAPSHHPSAAGRGCIRPAINAGSRQPVFCARLPDTTQQERHYGFGGESASVAAAALAPLTHTHTPHTHYSSRWGDADGGGPGPRVRARARGGGPARGADGPLEPTERGEQREMLRQQ